MIALYDSTWMQKMKNVELGEYDWNAIDVQYYRRSDCMSDGVILHTRWYNRD